MRRFQRGLASLAGALLAVVFAAQALRLAGMTGGTDAGLPLEILYLAAALGGVAWLSTVGAGWHAHRRAVEARLAALERA